MKKHLILGASSAIAVAASRRLAEPGSEFTLVARDPAKLAAVASDLRARGAVRVETIAADLGDIAAHEQLVGNAWDTMGGFDSVLLAYGFLGAQRDAERDIELAVRILQVNYTSAVSVLLHLANRFESRGRGVIAVITSVAGDRGRQSNYLYGSSKGGLSIFLEGLRNRLYPAGVSVVDIKPGFVETPMTAHLKKGVLFTTPEPVGAGIVKAMKRGAHAVYLPWFWLPIMTIIRSIPEAVFKRLKL